MIFSNVLGHCRWLGKANIKPIPAQVAALRDLLPAIGPDPEALAAAFGRRTKSRRAQITGILETLRSLGKL